MSDSNSNISAEDAEDRSTQEMINQYSSINYSNTNIPNMRRGKYAQTTIISSFNSSLNKGAKRNEPPDDYICKRCGTVHNFMNL
jgi:hypothetical protein